MVMDPKFRREISRIKSASHHRSNSHMPTAPSNGQSSNEHTGLLHGGPTRGPSTTHSENAFLRVLSQRSLTVVKVLRSSPVHPLILFLPFALLAKELCWSPVAIFVLGFLSVMALSSLMRLSLEEVSLYCRPWVGGLIIANLGNTVEVVMGIIALKHGEFAFIRSFLLGNVLHYLLFSLGCSYFIGGLKVQEQNINTTVYSTMMTILIAALSLTTIPAVAASISSHLGARLHHDMEMLSHGTAIVILLVYMAFLTFQLQTHIYLFDVELFDAEEEEEEEEEEHLLGPWAAGITFACTTCFAIMCIQNILDNLDAVVGKAHLNKTFIAFVLFPFLSSASLDIDVVAVALKDRMDLAVGTAINSAIQTVIFVTPLLVVVGWIMGRDLTLSFGVLQTVVVILSSFVVLTICNNGKSTYFDGILCLGIYIISVMTVSIFVEDRNL